MPLLVKFSASSDNSKKIKIHLPLQLRKKIKLRNAWANWRYTSPWEWTSCNPKCWRTWFISLHSELLVKSHGYGEVSQDWKMVNVTFMFKKVNKQLENYKFISLHWFNPTWLLEYHAATHSLHKSPSVGWGRE